MADTGADFGVLGPLQAPDDVAADKEADQLSRAVSDLEDEYARAG